MQNTSVETPVEYPRLQLPSAQPWRLKETHWQAADAHPPRFLNRGLELRGISAQRRRPTKRVCPRPQSLCARLDRLLRSGTPVRRHHRSGRLPCLFLGYAGRRVRMCHWKQWRHPHTKVRNLVRIGLNLEMAIKHAVTRKRYWRLSRTPAMRYAMPNKWLTQ